MLGLKVGCIEMSVMSIGYLLFVFVGLPIYYRIPQRQRYKWLIVLSMLFIYSCSPIGPVFVFGTSLIVYRVAKAMPSSKHAKRLLLISLGWCLGILLLLKYAAVSFPAAQKSFVSKYLYPVGLSYYTLQVISYLLDVYWGRIEPERDFRRILLFTSYFPQLIQGPISKYSELSRELFKQTEFEWRNLKYGVQLMLWGFFKKMVIADRIAGSVTEAFWSGNTPQGLTIWVGLFLYSIQLYCDFSGGIDIVRGISECYGIGLKQNFNQPYFSRSLGEFWRRWHISLGEWMKDYVFYPISTSKAMAKLKKKLKNRYSRKTATRVSIAIANIVVFALVGLWHGAGSNFIAWGLYNGMILALGGLLEDPFQAAKTKLRIHSDSAVWRGFCVARTFFIVMVGNAFDCASSCTDAVGMIFRMFDVQAFGTVGISFPFIGMLMAVALLAVDLLHERHISIRQTLNAKSDWVQFVFWIAVIQVIACLGKVPNIGGFLYANC